MKWTLCLPALASLVVPFLACGTSRGPTGFDDPGTGVWGADGSVNGSVTDGAVGQNHLDGVGHDSGADPDDSASPIFSNDAPTVDTGPRTCAAANYKAAQAPAALIVVLDKSGTMANAGKYSAAQLAIISAIDEPVFDALALGLLGYPTGTVTGPACVFNLPVLCGVSGLPQVPLNLAGANKSNASSGVRHDIYSWLAASSPAPGDGDGNPSYDAINSGINALKAFPMVGGKRVLVYITDGGASCTSVTNRPGYVDGNTCNDWEYPDSIVTLLKNAHDDTQTKINSFIVGVPGADTDGSNPNTPPYHVRNALSAYAYAGSPETVDPACDGKVFSKTGADPSVVCHFDMSQTYTSTKLSDAIKSIRGKVMGCTFDLPSADGGMVDKTKVNVTYSANGGVTIDLLKRSNPSDPCTASGCWDYDGNGKVELFGKACTDLQTAATANVHVLLGCDTNIK